MDIDLQQSVRKIILLPRSNIYDPRLSKLPRLPELRRNVTVSKRHLRSLSARDNNAQTSTPSCYLPTSISLFSTHNKGLHHAPRQACSLVSAKSNDVLIDPAPTCGDKAIGWRETKTVNARTRGRCLLKRQPTRATIYVKPRNESNGTRPRGRSSADGKDQSADEWDLLDHELRLKHHLFCHERSHESNCPPSPTPAKPDEALSDIEIHRIKSDSGYLSTTQKDFIAQTSSSSLILETPIVRTEESSLGSLKNESDSLTVVEGEPSHCWACRMENLTRMEGQAEAAGSGYNVHMCGRKNVEERLSLSDSPLNQSDDSEVLSPPMLTLEQIITAARRLSLKETPLRRPNYHQSPSSGFVHTPKKMSEVLTPSFTKKLLDSDEEGAGQLTGVPPVSVSSSEDEEPALRLLENKQRRHQIFASYRSKPKLLKKATLDSTDEDAMLVRNGPPEDLEDNSDKELEYLAKRNAYKRTRFPSTQSSYDMGNVNLDLIHKYSWNSSFSLPLSPMVRRRMDSIGAHGSFLGSLGSEDNDRR